MMAARQDHAAAGRASGEEELAGIKNPAEAGLSTGIWNATSQRAEGGEFRAIPARPDQKENPAEAGQVSCSALCMDNPWGDRRGRGGRPAALTHT